MCCILNYVLDRFSLSWNRSTQSRPCSSVLLKAFSSTLRTSKTYEVKLLTFPYRRSGSVSSETASVVDSVSYTRLNVAISLGSVSLLTPSTFSPADTRSFPGRCGEKWSRISVMRSASFLIRKTRRSGVCKNISTSTRRPRCTMRSAARRFVILLFYIYYIMTKFFAYLVAYCLFYIFIEKIRLRNGSASWCSLSEKLMISSRRTALSAVVLLSTTSPSPLLRT